MVAAIGALNSRVRFERQQAGSDEYGNVLTDSWAVLIDRWARLRPQFGKEALQAGRLDESAPATLLVRRCTQTLGITPADRVTVTAGPYRNTVWNIRSIIPTMDGADLEMVLERGVAI